MTKKLILPMLAAILVFTIVLGASAFKKEPSTETKKPVMDTYFQYAGPDESEAELEDYNNWTEITGGLPEDNPCDPGSIVCVSHLDNSTLAAQSGSTNAIKFVNYLRRNDVAPVSYIQANSDFEKQ